ncbi:NAD(P)/FAD-dependent oxidoreductase [Glaciecola sp. MF2-115]|uniref:NAD(P)/FAD-dependent oxidoreductase n=1 Tax=Glaciecola sp. MF2-115 TaxID=3384827 RepID=UPI0039A33754
MYDPLVDQVPPSNETKPDSFWAADKQAYQYPPLTGQQKTDVVIIGGGYTGLSCALNLAQEFGVECAVIEANQPGWGCSGRNGGFVLPGTGRLSVKQMRERWGKSVSQAIYREYLDSIDSVESLISDGIDCERSAGGYLKLAHKASLVDGLHRQAAELGDEYGDSIVPLSASDISNKYLSGTPSFGGIYYPNAVGVNPWMLCQGLAKKAQEAGVKIYGNSAISECNRSNQKHLLSTSEGSITANTLIVATNAYAQRNLHSGLKDRMFPVLSSIIVTEPLSEAELLTVGMAEGLMVMDTRPLKYYYRILPDKRLLFGGRGAIKGKHANQIKYQNALKEGLLSTFPNLANVKISSFWSGWVSVSLDDYPRIYHDTSAQTLYSGGYCGAGLAFSIQAGKRLAQLYCAPEQLPDLPYWKSPLKIFPLASARRPALQAFYAWEALKRKVGM